MQHIALCLEPPGNIGRDLSLFRRELFHASSEASALAFPDLAVLAWGRKPPGRSASLGSPLALKKALAACREGIVGAFSASAPRAFGDCLFLGLEGPLPDLCAAARSALRDLGLDFDEEPPFPPGLGFFLAKAESIASDAGFIDRIEAPSLSFLDCHLVLVRFETGPEPFAAARWSQLCRLRRRTGP